MVMSDDILEFFFLHLFTFGPCTNSLLFTSYTTSIKCSPCPLTGTTLHLKNISPFEKILFIAAAAMKLCLCVFCISSLLQKNVLVCKIRDLEGDNQHLTVFNEELMVANQQLKERQVVWAHTTPLPYLYVVVLTKWCHHFLSRNWREAFLSTSRSV